MTDEQVIAEWRAIRRQYDRGRSLARRLALARCDALEARGVTEGDIDRLFMTPTLPPSHTGEQR